jgi:integrase
MTVSETAHPRYSWRVTWREGKARKNRFFHSEKEARRFAASRKQQIAHIPRSAIPATDEEMRAIHEARHLGVSLMSALQHWQRTAGASHGMTFGEFIDARIAAAAKSAISEKHRGEMERRLEMAKETIGAIPAASITPQDLLRFIERWDGHHSQKMSRAALSAVFSHAIQMGWCQFNPALRLPLAPAPDDETAIFTVDEAADWLCCVAAHAPSCLAGWAISMFAGLRRAEIERLSWSEVRLERGHIEVTAKKAKTRNRRIVDILPNLAEILTPIAQEEGRVFPHSPKRAERWAFQAYGKRLPKNVARHSFVSYHLALFGDVSLTEMQAGHDREVLFQHYRELVTRTDAEDYFTIVV